MTLFKGAKLKLEAFYDGSPCESGYDRRFEVLEYVYNPDGTQTVKLKVLE